MLATPLAKLVDEIAAPGNGLVLIMGKGGADNRRGGGDEWRGCEIFFLTTATSSSKPPRGRFGFLDTYRLAHR